MDWISLIKQPEVLELLTCFDGCNYPNYLAMDAKIL